MTRKSKKELTKQIMMEVVDKYDYSQTVDIPFINQVALKMQSFMVLIRASCHLKSITPFAQYRSKVRKSEFIQIQTVIVENEGIRKNIQSDC